MSIQLVGTNEKIWLNLSMKKIEYFFKNILLRLLLLFSSPSKTPVTNLDFNKILFIRLNRIGDALVTTPLLHLVKKNIDCKIYLLADKKNYFAYSNNPDIDRLIKFNKGIKGILEIVSLVKRENIDTVVDLHDDVSTTVSFLIALSSAKNKFGLQKGNDIIYTKTVQRPDHTSVHVVDRLLQLAKLFNINPDRDSICIRYQPKDESLKKAEDYLNQRFEEKVFLVGINISSGSSARFWVAKNYQSLINFLKEYGINFLVLSSPDDIHLAHQVMNNEKLIFASVFDEFSALISKLNLLITPDTAAVHIAAAYNVPVFGIYVNYNTDEMIWTPYGSDFDCVVTKEPNLKNITPEQVILKLKPFLQKQLNEYGNTKLQKIHGL
jgi:ADP-heptose:LPS heptosyltransferase